MPLRLSIVDANPGALILARSVLSRAGHEVFAAPSLEELERRGPPAVDLILLDGLQATPAAYALLAERHPGAVLVLTVPRGRRASVLGRAARADAAGRVDPELTLEKPFDPDTLLAIVERATSAGAPTHLMDGVVPEVMDLFSDDTPTDSETALGAEIFGDDFFLTPPPLAGLALAPPDAVPGAMLDATPLPPSLQPLPVAPREVILHGRIGVVALDQILQLAANAGVPVCCRFRDGEARRIDIFVERHRVVGARQGQPAAGFLLGRFLVESGAIEAEALASFLAREHSPYRLIGAQLEERGLITRAQLEEALARQTEELVYEVVRWARGEFSVMGAGETTADLGEPGVELPVGHLLLEGLRRYDEWRRMASSLGGLGAVPVRLEAAARSLERLPHGVRQILGAVDGHRDVSALVRATEWPSFDVVRALAELRGQRLVRLSLPASG